MKVTKLFGTIAAVLGSALLATSAEAGGAFAEGTECSTQDKGDRYETVAYVEYEKIGEVCDVASPVDATIRISSKEGLHTFFANDVSAPNLCNPCDIMQGLIDNAALRIQILTALYPDEDPEASNRVVGVKEVGDTGVHGENITGGKRYRSISNAVVTVQ